MANKLSPTTAGMECCVCCHAYDLLKRSPRIAPCGHTLCTTCLRAVTACPMCRAPLPHDRGALPANFALQDILAAHEGSADRARLLDTGVIEHDTRSSSGLYVPAEDVVLTAVELGSGSFGRVVAGLYNGRQVSRLANPHHTDIQQLNIRLGFLLKA